jgi:hypothetical protein
VTSVELHDLAHEREAKINYDKAPPRDPPGLFFNIVKAQYDIDPRYLKNNKK